MEILALIVSACAIVVSLVFSWRNDRLARVEALKAFYEEGNSAEIANVMVLLYKHIKEGDFDRDTFSEIGTLLGFYDKWCTLCLYGYLPIWVFKGNPGRNLVVFYEYTKQYISERRVQEHFGYKNPNYSMAIEKIAARVVRKYLRPGST